MENKNTKINQYISDVKTILDDSVHGHDDAKRQVERIIGQWINGDKSGYCFALEGPPVWARPVWLRKELQIV